MKLIKIFTIAIIVLGIVIVGFIVYFIIGIASLGVGTCKNQTISEAHSNDNYYNAVYYVRDCGATTDFSSQVKISKLKNRELFAGNEETVFVTGNDRNIKMEWVGEKDLRIIYSGNDQIFKQLNFWQDVKIGYAVLVENSENKK